MHSLPRSIATLMTFMTKIMMNDIKQHTHSVHIRIIQYAAPFTSVKETLMLYSVYDLSQDTLIIKNSVYWTTEVRICTE